MKSSVCVVSNKGRREEMVYCFARREFVEDLTCVEEFRSVQSERYSTMCTIWQRKGPSGKELKARFGSFW